MRLIEDTISIMKSNKQDDIVEEEREKIDFFIDCYVDVLNMYDFENRQWKFLPFSGGYTEQKDINSWLWQVYNYFIYCILKEKG